MLLTKLAYSRRSFSRAKRANSSIVHRTSNIVHRRHFAAYGSAIPRNAREFLKSHIVLRT